MHHRRKSSLNRTPSSSPRSSVCLPNLRKVSRKTRPLFLLVLAIGIPVLYLVWWMVLSVSQYDQQQHAIVQVSLDVTRKDQGGSGSSLQKTEVVVRDEIPLWVKPEASLNFPYPTALGRDNLRNDTYYIIGFALAGFTNQFIAYMHLIYLGMHSNRIPVMPPFVPSSHVSNSAGALRFGSVFNLTRLSTALRRPIIEWANVKSYTPDASVSKVPVASDSTVDHFGCWSVRQQNFPTPIWVPAAENVLRLDLSFTRVPPLAFFDEKNKGDVHTRFDRLAVLVLPKHPHPASKGLPLMAASRLGSRLEPDERMACFDFLYYVSTGIKRHEFENRWSPAWNIVGTYLRFADGLLELARDYVKRAFGVANGEELLPFITVHIRRGDFRSHCTKGRTPPCYLPLRRYDEAIKNAQKQLLDARQIEATRVLVASDEKDPEFWQEVETYGWVHLNHTTEKTLDRHGEWYPIIIDSASLSLGAGFVGTKSSTYSVLSARRVEDWNDGVAEFVSYLD